MKAMRTLRAFAIGAVALFALSACDTLKAAKGDVASLAASIADPFVPASVQAPVSNVVLGLEGIYTASGNVIADAMNRHLVTVAQSNELEAIDAKVYAALVDLRMDAAAGKDVTAALDTFNHVYGDLITKAAGDGLTLPALPATK